jgi:DNA-binding transcriptional LysR family regulator
MRNLNLDQLQTFATVIEHGSFSAAARVLNLTQPAVSMQVKELEERLGVQLVERATRRILPTAAGRDLLEHIRRLQRESAHALHTMRRHKDGWLGQVRIGASTTALIYHMPPVLQHLKFHHPNIEVRVATGTTTTIVEMLSHNHIDLGLVTLPITDADVDVTSLLTESLVAIVPAGTPGLPAKISPDDFVELGPMLELPRAQVRRLIDQWLSASGKAARPLMELDNIEAIKTIVAAGLGASIVPNVVVSGVHANERLDIRPLDPPLTRTLAIVERRRQGADAARERVKEALLTLAQRPAEIPRKRVAVSRSR